MNQKRQRANLRIVKAVHYGLKNLDYAVALKKSALINLPQVPLLAQGYGKSSWAQAYALRDILTSACQQVLAAEVTNRRQQRILTFLRLYLGNPNAAAIARTLGMDRKNLYDYVMPAAYELVADELQNTHTAPTAQTS